MWKLLALGSSACSLGPRSKSHSLQIRVHRISGEDARLHGPPTPPLGGAPVAGLDLAQLNPSWGQVPASLALECHLYLDAHGQKLCLHVGLRYPHWKTLFLGSWLLGCHCGFLGPSIMALPEILPCSAAAALPFSPMFRNSTEPANTG